MPYTFFYSHTGPLGYLSQFYPCKFHVNGVQYNCAEQFMMAQKAYMFGDFDYLEEIMWAAKPATQKALGGLVTGFDPTVWNSHCVEIVYNGNFAKFTQNDNLHHKLLETKGLLVEASPYDRIWGIGMGVNDPNLHDTSLWGENKLGKILTEIREKI